MFKSNIIMFIILLFFSAKEISFISSQTESSQTCAVCGLVSKSLKKSASSRSYQAGLPEPKIWHIKYGRGS